MITNDKEKSPFEYQFKGLSTDKKPTACSANSVFLELDTGEVYYFDGSEWKKVGGGA